MPFIILDDPEISEPVSAYHIPGPIRTCPLLLLIPGNPGLAGYYSLYLEGLKLQFPDYELLCSSHLGADGILAPKSLISYPGSRIYSLQDHIEHTINVLKWASKAAGDVQEEGTANRVRDVIIMGHSMGAWVAQRVVVRLLNTDEGKNIRFRMVGLLTPTIRDIHNSINGKRVSRTILSVTNHPGYLIGRIVQLLHLSLPEFIIRYLITRVQRSVVFDHATNATASMLSRPSIVVQAGEMLVEEMAEIREDFPEFWESSAIAGFQVWGFFALKDRWVSLQAEKELIEEYGHLENVTFDSGKADEDGNHIIHAFCLRQSIQFADITAERIKELVTSVTS